MNYVTLTIPIQIVKAHVLFVPCPRQFERYVPVHHEAHAFYVLIDFQCSESSFDWPKTKDWYVDIVHPTHFAHVAPVQYDFLHP